MSHDLVLPTHERPPVRHLPGAWCALAAAAVLAGLRPYRIRQVLRLLRRGAAPATAEQTLLARTVVSAVSRHCAGPQGCLRRSLATVLLCRLRGVWPTWGTGVRTHPFSAHAWVAVGGRPVGEPPAAASYTPILTVPPLPAPDAPRPPG